MSFLVGGGVGCLRADKKQEKYNGMGYWCTLHLIDDQKFYKEVVPELKGDIGNLESIGLEFLKLHVVGGIARYSKAEVSESVEKLVKTIHSISNLFDKSFKIHAEFDKIEAYEERQFYLGNVEGYFDFCKFFEYYVFKRCADFFPHVPLGKGGLSRNFNLGIKTLSYSLISELDGWNEFLSGDMMGITNWLGKEDVELLYLDRENLDFKDNAKGEAIFNFIEIGYKNKLGLVVGIDMKENRLERLPANKLISAEAWRKLNTEGMLFKR